MNHDDEIAELRARLDKLEGKRTTAEPPRVDSLERDARGRVIQDETIPDYDTRMASERDARARADDEAWAERTAGLPDGQWNDCGLIRDSQGRAAGRTEAVAKRAEVIERERAAQHRAERVRDGLVDEETGAYIGGPMPV